LSEKFWEPFRCDVVPERDAVRVVPVGELDLACAGGVAAQLDDLFGAGLGHVVLDLRELTFLDSSGLRMILEAKGAAKERSVRFTLIPGRPEVQRVFEVTGTGDSLFDPAH
jgi:anti-sigma B factor antagonist